MNYSLRNSQSNTVNVTALKVVPYAVLVKAIISIAVLIFSVLSLISASDNDAANSGLVDTAIVTSFESVHLITLAIYIILIIHLNKLDAVSDYMRKARTATLITAGLYFLELFLTAAQIELYTNDYYEASTVVFWITNVALVAKAMGLVIVILYLTKGFAERLEAIGHPDVAHKVSDSGRLYLGINVIMLCITNFVEFTAVFDMEYVVGASAAIGAVIEMYIFAMLRKSACLIWQNSRKD